MKFRLYPIILATATLLLICTSAHLGYARLVLSLAEGCKSLSANIQDVYSTPPIVAIAHSVAQESPSKDPQAEAVQLFQQGTELLNSGESQAALEVFQQVLDIVRRLNQRLGEAGTLSQIALAYYNLGEYQQARESYQQALTIYTEEKNLNGQGVILTNLGELYQNIGPYQKALESHEQALAIFKTLEDRPKQGAIISNLGVVYQTLGQDQEALQYYQEALEIHRQFRDNRWQATILNNLGSIYEKLAEYERALDSFQEALALAEQEGDRIEKGRILNNIGRVSSKLGQQQRALQSLQQALMIRREIQDRPGEGTTLHDMGTVYRDLGQYEVALQYYNKALEMARKMSSRPQEGETLSNIGITLLKAGFELEATEKLLESIKIWESLRPGLTDENKVSLFERQAETYRWLQQALIAQNKVEAALEVSERGRARAFTELLASRLSESEVVQSPSHLEFEEIQKIAQHHNATLVEYSIINGQLYIWVIRPQGQLEFRIVDLSILESSLPMFAEKTRVAAAIGLNRSGENQSQVLPEFVRQTREQVETVSEADSSIMADMDRRNVRLHKSYQLLIEPIADLLPKNPDSHLIFIPHGELFIIPFAALQDQQGTYLIEKHTILIAPSIQVLDLTYQHKKRLHQGVGLNTVVIGNPQMPSISTRPGEKPKPLDALPGTEREALAIAQMLKTEAIIGDRATEDAVIHKMPQARIIHMATHGLLNELKHLGLNIPGALALTPTPKNDGLLTAGEIFNLRLNAELVVLSACNTGRGRITEDGVIGLSRSFISAGVPSVVVSLWFIPDNPSADLMIEFYRQMQTLPDKASALRQAMLITMKQHPNPSDWAGFLLIGQGY